MKKLMLFFIICSCFEMGAMESFRSDELCILATSLEAEIMGSDCEGHLRCPRYSAVASDGLSAVEQCRALERILMAKESQQGEAVHEIEKQIDPTSKTDQMPEPMEGSPELGRSAVKQPPVSSSAQFARLSGWEPHIPHSLNIISEQDEETE